MTGDWPGHLHALMLDTKGTFDDLVQRYARTPGAGRIDPVQPALPEPGRRALRHAGVHGDGEALRAGPVRRVRRGGGRHTAHPERTRPARCAASPDPVPREPACSAPSCSRPACRSRAVGVATQALLRTIAKVAGAEIVQDAVAFFQAFEGMEDGFRSRAAAVRELLSDPPTAYVLVTSAPTRRGRRGQASSPRSWPSATSRWRRSSSTGSLRPSATARGSPARLPVPAHGGARGEPGRS